MRICLTTRSSKRKSPAIYWNRRTVIASGRDSGYFGLGPWYYDMAQPPQARADERHDRVDALTRGFLGLTVACARCHDHKYDPIASKDYYALAGVFASSDYREYPLVSNDVVEAYQRQKQKIADQEKVINQYIQTMGGVLAGIRGSEDRALSNGGVESHGTRKTRARECRRFATGPRNSATLGPVSERAGKRPSLSSSRGTKRLIAARALPSYRKLRLSFRICRWL